MYLGTWEKFVNKYQGSIFSQLVGYKGTNLTDNMTFENKGRDRVISKLTNLGIAKTKFKNMEIFQFKVWIRWMRLLKMEVKN